MADNINISVNETIDNIVINPSISTDVIDFNISSTTETVNIAVTPELTTVNINSVTGGLVSSVNGQIGDVIIPTSDNNFTNALKTKLDGIQSGAEVNVNSDWNAVSGDAQILNKPTIPSITNLVPYTGANQNVNLGTNDIYLEKVFLNDAVNGGYASIHYVDSDLHIEDADGHKLLVIEDGFIQLHKTDTIQSNLYTSGLTQTRDHYLPDASGTIALISNITGTNSGVNTGDETTATIKSKLGITTLSGSNTGDQDLSNLVVKNTAITGATKTKITYDSKGLVTAGSDATTADIADSTNKRYQTDNQQSFNDATSSIQTQLNAKATDSAVVHLAGTETITGKKTLNPSVTASGLLAQGTILTPTLTAAANNDVLVGLDIAPTFTNGAFTGLSNYAVRHTGDIVSTVSNSYNLGGVAMPYNTVYTRIIRDITQISYRSDNQGWFNNANTQTAKLFSTGNLILQNGGTFTEVASSRLTVNSTTQGILAPRMTNAQKIAISSPATGLLAYDTDLATLSQYNGSAWVAPYKYINTTSSVVSATVAETIVSTATIPANAFNSSDIMKFLFEIGKGTTTVGVNIRIKINTSNTLTGATTIATYTVPLANTYALMKRNFILNGGSLYGYNFTNAASVTDEITSTISNNSTTYNTSNTLYVFFTMQLGSTLDNANFLMANITN